MARNDWQLGYRAMRNMSRRDPGTFDPGQSEMGVVARRGSENPPRPDGTRYRPRALSRSLDKPDPYWRGSPASLVYPD